MNADQLIDMQEVVEDAKANALRFPEISFDDLEALVKLGFECLKLCEAQCWIPVSERLPKPNQRVNVITNWDGFLPFFYVDEEGDWVSENYQWGGQVTHWMPLPDWPTEVEL